MKGLLLASLLSSAAQIRAHPHAGPESNSKHALTRRTVNLNSFRQALTAVYANSTETASNTTIASTIVKREDYVETATELVKITYPDLTFRVVGDNYVGDNGIGHVNFKQTVHGLDIDNADFNVNVGKDGKIFSFGNTFFTGDLPAESPLVKRDHADPVAALKGASNILQLPVGADSASAEAVEGQETYSLKGTSGAVSDPEARLVYFKKDNGTLALTWRVETNIVSNWLLSYVDATSTEVVHGVVDWAADASYQVYPWGVNDPDQGSRVTVSNPWDKTASEFGWQSTGGTTNYTTTRGNNGIAGVNPSGGDAYLSNYRPTSATQNFVYAYSPSTTSPTSYRDASITQLFYTANVYHDVLYKLGFTEKAGNFEVNNNGQGGTGSDFVVLHAQDGSGTDNANFATPPDGQPGVMRMYLWTQTTPKRDCSFDASVVIHEYTHGLSTRLTGGPANSNCLNALESGGMGEGWGDFMATAIRLKASDTRATNYPLGAWIYGNTAGIRSYLYSTSKTTNPLVYTSLNTLDEVHDIGEMWANVLYELLWNLIDKYGKSTATFPTFSNGIPTDGKFLAMKLVIDAMALQPCNPNMVQARSAIIDADVNLTGGVNKCAIWTAFAKRGLGSGAVYKSGARTGSSTIPSGVC